MSNTTEAHEFAPDKSGTYKDACMRNVGTGMDYYVCGQPRDAAIHHASTGTAAAPDDSHCAHCDKDFVSLGEPGASLCPPCFMAGHRGFICGKSCVVTEKSKALAQQWARDYAANPNANPRYQRTVAHVVTQPAAAADEPQRESWTCEHCGNTRSTTIKPDVLLCVTCVGNGHLPESCPACEPASTPPPAAAAGEVPELEAAFMKWFESVDASTLFDGFCAGYGHARSAHDREVDELREALRRIFDAYEADCGCECNNKNCCAVVNEPCAKCFARAALERTGDK